MSSDVAFYSQINAERQDTFKRFINSLNFFVILLLALILQGSIYHYQRYKMILQFQRELLIFITFNWTTNSYYILWNICSHDYCFFHYIWFCYTNKI